MIVPHYNHRLDYIVDYFVVCEANKDHTGNSKEFNFNPKIPKHYKNKIIYIKVENLPTIKIKGNLFLV